MFAADCRVAPLWCSSAPICKCQPLIEGRRNVVLKGKKVNVHTLAQPRVMLYFCLIAISLTVSKGLQMLEGRVISCEHKLNKLGLLVCAVLHSVLGRV